MKKRILRALSSGMTYGALVGMILFLFNTPADSVLLQTLKILLVAAICGLVAGLFFTLVLILLEVYRSKTYDPFRQELSSEGEILLEDSGRRLLADRFVRGWLFLTPETLSFCNSSKELRKILLADIETVQITDPKHGYITVTMKTGESEVFAVADAVSWFDAIGDASHKE